MQQVALRHHMNQKADVANEHEYGERTVVRRLYRTSGTLSETQTNEHKSERQG